MTYSYIPKGVCSRKIDFEIENGIITAVKFTGGCGIGRTPEDVIKTIEGIKCGPKPTSCPDQLAQALKQAIAG